MKIKFKDGHKIEFNKYGNIWFADSVIWEKIQLYDSLDDLRELKAKIDQWFEKNAPDEIREKYNARLPLWREILTLPFKYKIVYRKGKKNQIADYFLGDEEDRTHPIYFTAGYYNGDSWFTANDFDFLSYEVAVRLCLEER